MNAILNKTNNGKRLIAAVAIFAMLACVLAVAMPVSAEVTEGSSGEPVDFNAELAAYTGSIPDSPNVTGLGATNVGLGNDISVEFDETNNTYYVSGFVNKQNIAYTEGNFVGTNYNNDAKVFYSYNWDYAKEGTEVFGQYWGIVFGTLDGAKYTNAAGEVKDVGKTSIMLYLTADSLDDVRTISYTTGEPSVTTTYNLDFSGVELSDTVYAVDEIKLDNETTVTLPEGVRATVTETTAGYNISVYGTPSAATSDDTVEGTANNFVGTFHGKDESTVPWGYAFAQINGLDKIIGENTVKITQTNSALGWYDGNGDLDVSGIKKVDNTYVKDKDDYTKSNTQYYAFLIPQNGGEVKISVGVSPAVAYTFDFQTEGASAEISDPTEATEYFQNGASTVTVTSAPNDVETVIMMPDEEGKTLVLPATETTTSFALAYGADAESAKTVATFSGLKGTGLTFSHGSIVIGATQISGGTITINEPNQTIYLDTAAIATGGDANKLTITLSEGSQLVIRDDVELTNAAIVIEGPTGDDITAASVLVQEGVDFIMDDNSTLTLSNSVRLNNYGNIDGGKVIVNKGATFYSATPINTVFDGDGNIDLSDAMETLKISDKLASSAVLKPTQNVLVNGNLTINKGEYLIITGSLEVQEGVTVTINEGGLLMVYGPSASADIQGTIVSKGAFNGNVPDVTVATGAGGFTYYNGKSIDISGTVTAKKATNDDVRTVWINGDSEISGTVTIDSKAKAEFGGETKIVEGGVLNINGTYAGTILNQGTVNLNGAVDAGAVVSMNSTTAVLNVTALKGTNDLAVNDEGLYLQTDDDGNRIIVGEAADTTVNAITLNNVKGVTVTEGYTYTTDSNGDRIVNNNLYIAGTLNAQDSKDPNVGAMEITSGVLSVTGDLTIAKVNVTIGTDAEMDVTGNVYITNVDDVDFTGTGTLTVTGLVRSADELEANGFTINAVKYEQTIENVPYYFYTSLAAAIASGEENLTVLGDLWILEDTTIPAGITVDASANNVFVGDDSKDITDITLTVANGGLLMAQKIEVDATMMIPPPPRPPPSTPTSTPP